MSTTIWSRIPPKSAGWYWWRFQSNSKPECVQYGIPHGLPACVDLEHYSMWRVGVDDGQEIDGEWGPEVHLPEPLSEFASDDEVMAAILAAPVMVFWSCDECDSSVVTWEHGRGTSQATCQRCGKSGPILTRDDARVNDASNSPACGSDLFNVLTISGTESVADLEK